VLTEFWKAVGGKLADRFAAVSVPALVFWLGGLAAWIVHQGNLAAVTRRLAWLDRQGAGVQLTVLLTVLLAVAGSGIVVGELAAPVLRLLEGYWPRWADRFGCG
jgi:nitrate/nitrite transporter NarK